MSVFNRLGLNFDTKRFGQANTLSSGAANTLGLIGNTTPQFAEWQINVLETGPIVRTDFFKNPTVNFVNGMISSLITLQTTANTINATTLEASANSLVIELNAFKSHTDNISGVVLVQDMANYPSYDSAGSVGQITIMNLTKTDGPQQNTDSMLGAFTSLFIPDILSANNIQLNIYATTITESTSNTDPILDVASAYCNSTSSIISTRRLEDWNFYRNSLQVTKDAAFLQQFNNMGATQTYLVMNVVGTPSLVNNLKSNN